jgi:hypothetical protein
MADRKLEIIIGAKDKATAVINSVKSGLVSFGQIAKKAIIGIGVAVAGATIALTAIVAKTLEANDGLAKTADKLGITTEALSALRLAGDLAGVSIENMDKALEFMLKTVSDARQGLATAKDAFAELGLNADDLANARPEEAFIKIVGALKEVDKAAQIDLSKTIFGRAGADTLNLTVDALRQAQEEAEIFGIALNRADAKKMENVNDAVTRVKAAFQGAGTSLTVALVEPLEGLALKLVDLAKNGSLKAWATDVGRVAGQVLDFISTTVLGIGKFDAALGIVGNSFDLFLNAARTAFNTLAAVSLSNLQTIVGAFNSVSFGKIAGLDELEANLDVLRRGAEESAEKSSDAWVKASIELENSWTTLSEKTERPKTAAEELAAGLKDSGDNAKVAASSFDAVGFGLETTGDKADEAKGSVTALGAELEKIASNERIKNLEIKAQIKTADIEAQTARITSAFTSIDNTVSSTSSNIGALFGQLSSAGSFGEKWAIESQIEQENALREEAFDLQKRLTDEQIKSLQMRNKAMERGDGLIKIQMDGVEPELEMVMWKILERVQVRVNEEAADFLLTGA